LRLLAESSGRPLEADGNVGPREMAVTAAQAAGQNPAYGRPIRPFSVPCWPARARRARRARSRLPAQVRRVVTNRRPAPPQPTVRDQSAPRERRVATSRRNGLEARRGAATGLPSVGARGHDSPLRFAAWSPTVGRHRRSRHFVTSRRNASDALRPAHDGPEARRGATTSLPPGGTGGHDSPLRFAAWSPTVGRHRRSRHFLTDRRNASDALRPAHDGPEARRGATTSLPSGGTGGHDSPPSFAAWSTTVGRHRRRRRVATSPRRTGGAAPAGTAPPLRTSLASTARTRPSAPGSRRCRGTAPRRRAQPGGWSAGRSC